jgi:hypothetical protein
MTGSGLIVNRGQTKITSKAGFTDQELFDSVKAELEESPEIEGFVFLLEETIAKPLAWASVTKREMGIAWPVNVLVVA